MLNDLLKHYQKKLPFVAFKVPHGNKLKCYFQADDHTYHPETYTESGFVFAPFSETDILKSVLFPSTKCTVETLELSDLDIKSDVSTSIYTEHLPKSYSSVIETAIVTIRKGALKKVVLSKPFIFNAENLQPLSIFEKMLLAYPSAFVYCWYHPKVGTWLGATPETLLNIQGNKLSTMSLAGTQKHDGETNVIWQQKELDEQAIVTKYIIDKLMDSGIDINNITSAEIDTIRAGNLWHLLTKIEAVLKLDEFNLKRLLNNLHPTPAVCGKPKDLALDFINTCESYDREYYTGFLGEINVVNVKERNKRNSNVENTAYKNVTKSTQLFVNLRCMQLKDEQAIIYVGGGITKDSDAEKEWQELLAKLHTVKSML